MKKVCPNCHILCEINEHANHCRNCGRIFLECIIIMKNEKIQERTTTRRTGQCVDQLDG